MISFDIPVTLFDVSSYNIGKYRVANSTLEYHTLRPEVKTWLDETCQHGFTISMERRVIEDDQDELWARLHYSQAVIEFENANDAMLFKLTWL